MSPGKTSNVVSGWKTFWAKKDDKKDQCASRVEDSSNTNQCAVDGDLRFILKVGSSFCNQCAVDVARSSLDFSNTNQWGKKEAGSSPSSSGKWAAINVHPEWKILQTLTNGAKRKLDHLLLHLLDHILLHLVNGLLWKTNDESGTPCSQSGWKTSWAKKDDKEDQCASRVEDSSNTNQWGKKKAGSSPPSSGKWAAVEN
ncbi:hypothetical protein Tco_1373280 [Tanacetum coccineum]